METRPAFEVVLCGSGAMLLVAHTGRSDSHQHPFPRASVASRKVPAGSCAASSAENYSYRNPNPDLDPDSNPKPELTHVNDEVLYLHIACAGAELITVAETAPEAVAEDKDSINGIQQLSQEATIINQSFSQQVCSHVSGFASLPGM